MNAVAIQAAIEARDAVEGTIYERAVQDAELALIETVKAALLAVDGVDAVVAEHGSMGSIYFECFNDSCDDATISVKFRVSNHKAGRRANELAGNVESGFSVERIQSELNAVATAIASEVEFACC